jgi:hypothetical protein
VKEINEAIAIDLGKAAFLSEETQYTAYPWSIECSFRHRRAPCPYGDFERRVYFINLQSAVYLHLLRYQQQPT